ncbi:DUF2703 domain-containing protein [Anaerosporomusa subterranea]|uniref:DUF2703 domain-containing protein n=1 Tax=Anaerosporomusa subterranea TaxID=1794912 RepID=UPI0008249240|nr:DUF2703 domain-containing protein [Anaerosporomusa subterranea]
MTNEQNGLNTSCCSCNSGCCGSTESAGIAKRHICIDFMYLDLSVCSRCQGTDDTLYDAIAETSAVLKATDVDVTVNKMHVASEEQARQLRFSSSPTIRVNGRDIQMEIRESLCESCGDLCGDEVDCRLWVYQGKEYTVPPKAMIIDAILRDVYGNAENSISPVEEFIVPDNLKRFFQSKQRKDSEDGYENQLAGKLVGPCCERSLR